MNNNSIQNAEHRGALHSASETTPQETKTATVEPSKKTYETPKIELLGNVANLTRGY